MAKVKICGITNIGDATWTATLGADYMGFNFYPKSQRKISVKMAADIISKIPPISKPVALFVNEEIPNILNTLKKTKINIIQLHGNESLEYCINLKLKLLEMDGKYTPAPQVAPQAEPAVAPSAQENITAPAAETQQQAEIPAGQSVELDANDSPLETEPAVSAEPEVPAVKLPEGDISTSIKIIKAFKIKGEGTVKYMARFRDVADYFLLDAYVPGEEGGTGEVFNWDLAVEAKKYNKPIFLAGGLTPENVADAIEKVQPFAVDVASGVERLPKRKDFNKLKQFIVNAKKF